MKTKFTLLFLSVVLMCSCEEADKPARSKKSTKDTAHSSRPSSSSVPVQPQDKPAAGEYCIIRKLYTEKGTTYIDADYIQFLMGKQAIVAARQRGEAEISVNKKGDTTYSVPDNVYVVNDNIKIRKLPLAKNVQLVFVAADAGKLTTQAQDFSELKKKLKNGIFILTLKGDVVTTIKEQYLP